MLLFSRLVVSDFASPWTTARQASLSFTISQGLLKKQNRGACITWEVFYNYLAQIFLYLCLYCRYVSITIFLFMYLIYLGIYLSVCACSVTLSSYSLQPHGLQPTRFLCLWSFPSKNSGASCHFLLQGTFPTQEWNLHLLHLLNWQVDSLPMGSPHLPIQLHIYLSKENTIAPPLTLYTLQGVQYSV